jgi:hypothetical protein
MEMPVILLPLPGRRPEMPQALPPGERTVVRLLRRWAASRASNIEPLPDLVAFAEANGIEPPVAVAADSLFQLTEACLSRDLQAERLCSARLGSDERAVLALLRVSPDTGALMSSPAVPHGLPWVLRWSALVLRRLLGGDAWNASASAGSEARSCPFRHGPAAA